MSRQKIIAGNWKMNILKNEAKSLVDNILKLTKDTDKNKVEILVCPSFAMLDYVSSLTKSTNVSLGAQDCSPNEKGAFTGDVSPLMIKDVGCKYTLIGHSERRTIHNEDDLLLRNKMEAAIKNGLKVILCVGETLEEKESGKTIEVVSKQLKDSFTELLSSDNLVIAYEPVWAIGTGKVPTTEEIQVVHSEIRKFIRENLIADADKIRILYGGSLKPSNAKEILALEDVDGGLIGGASLVPEDFVGIIKAC